MLRDVCMAILECDSPPTIHLQEVDVRQLRHGLRLNPTLVMWCRERRLYAIYKPSGYHDL